MSEIINIPQLTLLEQIARIERDFRGTSYDAQVDQLLEFYNKGSYKGVEEMLKRFPTEEQLLAKLVEKLQKKPVYATLKKIIEGEEMNAYQKLKGITSLMTHIVIECEQGNMEYKQLLPMLYERIGSMLFQLRGIR